MMQFLHELDVQRLQTAVKKRCGRQLRGVADERDNYKGVASAFTRKGKDHPLTRVHKD